MMKILLLLTGIILIAAGAFLLGVSYTGMAVYEDAVGELCLSSSDCAAGLVCCLTETGSGICYQEELCSSVYYFTESDRITNIQQLKETNSKQYTTSSILLPVLLFLAGLALIYFYLHLSEPQLKRLRRTH
ncbi:MAG TPA: hypothetical protein VJ461_02065 [Candidatus Nanoarchaeia archaeon]|nr:hypothetical protein [Candidatus Nanoarchaeia archaeon]